MLSFNLKEKTFILFVIFTLLQSPTTIFHIKPLLLYACLLFLSMVLLLINTHKSKTTAWIIVLIAAIVYLFNPSKTASNPQYSYGSLIAFIQGIIAQDYTTALMQLTRTLIPILLMVYSIIELKHYESLKLDKTMGLIFVIAYLFSLVGFKLIAKTFRLSPYIDPLTFFVLYVVVLYFWNRLENIRKIPYSK